MNTIIFVLFIFAMITTVQQDNSLLDNSDSTCIHSFEEFAYQGYRESDNELFLPTDPWKLEIDLAKYDIVRVDLVRESSQGQEVWLVGSDENNEIIWIIYYPETRTTQIIPKSLPFSDLLNSGLFLDSKGKIWATVSPMFGYQAEYEDRESVPILSRFNEEIQQFELTELVLPKFPLTRFNDDIFWFYIENDIYTYNINDQAIKHRISVPYPAIYGPSFAVDDRLYFHVPELDYPTNFLTGQIIEYRISTNELTELDLPEEPWPDHNGPLHIDQKGRLWLGATGYRDKNGHWNLVHMNPQYPYETDLFLYTKTVPTLSAETSDGRLWFLNVFNTDGDWQKSHGSAWYDPDTGEGCMFTNLGDLGGSVVEDSNQQLWVVVDKKLFTAPLHP